MRYFNVNLNMMNQSNQYLCFYMQVFNKSIILFLFFTFFNVYSKTINNKYFHSSHTRCNLNMQVTDSRSNMDSSALPGLPSVWTVFSDLAIQTGGSNLGQGFPDWNPPEFIMKSLEAVTKTNFHQYTRPAGHLPLVESIAFRYSTHLNRLINPYDQITITVGASQALYLTLMTILKPNDEVIIFEPFFDLYLKQIKLTGANPKFVPLGGPSATLEDPWALDLQVLKNSINSKTRMILLNSPHNPTGKVFTKFELEAIAEIVRENPRLIVVSDEVYKFTIYDPKETGDSVKGHYHFAGFPDMWDRTITLSSCGKTFSVTGWQVGWAVGPERFIKPIQNYIPCVQFCASTPIQHALSLALKEAELPYEGYSNYYEWLRSQFSRKRIILEKGLAAVGITAMPSQGGFFLMAKLPQIDLPLQDNFAYEPYDWRYLKYLATEIGVVGIPASPFFSSTSKNQIPMARFAFCKEDATLIAAAYKLMNYDPTKEKIEIDDDT